MGIYTSKQQTRLLNTPQTAMRAYLKDINLNPEPVELVEEVRGIDEITQELTRMLVDAQAQRNRIYVEEYPGDAGASIGTCPTAFDRYENESQDISHLQDPDTWELAEWLMTNKLSGSARDKYFKLKKVKFIYPTFIRTLTVCFRTNIFLGKIMASLWQTLILYHVAPAGNLSRLQSKEMEGK